MSRTTRKTSFFERAALEQSLYGRVTKFLSEDIWQIDPRGLDRWRRMGLMVLRVVYLVGRGFVSSRVQLQASALTYTSILALVPLFAVIFAFFQAFGGLAGTQARVQEFLIDSIAATPDQAKLIQERLPELMANVQKNVQAGSGAAPVALIFLALTVVLMLGSIESTLNLIWGVKRQRAFFQKFIVYWAVATLGPMLLGAALMTSSNILSRFENELSPSRIWSRIRGKTEAKGNVYRGATGALAAEVEERLHYESPFDALEYVATGQRAAGGSKLLGLFLTSIAFTLLYALMPNTHVHWRPALVGGVVAALLWQASRWGLTKGSSALVGYNTIYGSLATIPILMFWLYVTWIVVILGAELTFAIQNMRAQGREELALEASQKTCELVALRLATAIAEAFDRGDPPPSLSSLAKRTGAPTVLCAELLFHLCEDGFLRELDLEEEERGYLPARPIDRITLADLIRSLRDRRGKSFGLERASEAVFIETHLEAARLAEDSVAGLVTLERVVREINPRPIGDLGATPRHQAPEPTPLPETREGEA